MTSPKMRRRARRRAMLTRRRRYIVSLVGRFPSPHGAITHHEIPRVRPALQRM